MNDFLYEYCKRLLFTLGPKFRQGTVFKSIFTFANSNDKLLFVSPSTKTHQYFFQ